MSAYHKIMVKIELNKKSFIVLMVAAFSFIFGISSCQTARTMSDENDDDNLQPNGLAILNIKEPLILEPFETSAENMGDGTFHDAAFIAKDMQLGLNLGNTMEAYNASGCEKYSYTWIPVIGNNTPANYETCWGAPVTTQEMIDGIKAAGFNTVRIPVFWGNMMENDGTWTINKKYLERVREIVDYCFNDDLYVVVNIHHFDEFVIRRNSIDDCRIIFTNLWSQIASYFNNYSEKLVFEGYNEYLGGKQFSSSGYLAELPKSKAYELTNEMNKAFVDAVRATGGNNENRVLIISGYWTNIDLTTSKEFIVPEDSVADRLMVSVHYVDNSMYWSRQIGGANWEKYIDSQIALLNKAFTSRNIPVFLGETTAHYPKANFTAAATHSTSSECLEYVLTKLTDNGFVPVIWDTPENFYLRKEQRINDDADKAVISRIAGILKERK